ncbi:MAG: ornithine cyclodeaminase [Kiritimatiellia bacterium]|jgi:ornithine cyclodeaminase/alanine dehydrogenase-like protein (mu-crystallin family)|nr:ornithine cyclodeaminase [Kiritimatiellia bacterium]
MNPDRSLQFFSASDVSTALPMKDAVEAMKGVFLELSSGNACVPPRTHVAIPEHAGDALFMPSYSPNMGRMGLKVVTLHPKNRELGLPFIQALVMVLDAVTGTPLAVMNGAALTAIRTGAASGAATDVLAREDASQVAIFGAGVQAETQLEAVCSVRAIRRVTVFDISTERAEAFAAKMQESLHVEVNAMADSAAALAGADVVCTATTSEIPVFADAEIASGTHINAIGSYKPHVREIPPDTVARACVVVDQVEAAWEEAGDLIMARDEGVIEESHIQTELGQVIAGDKSGRQNDEQITFFKSVGVATQDLAAACAVLEKGESLGLGTRVEL